MTSLQALRPYDSMGRMCKTGVKWESAQALIIPEVALNARNLHGFSHHARQTEGHLFWELLTVHAGLHMTSRGR